jgi:hypothetical protein
MVPAGRVDVTSAILLIEMSASVGPQLPVHPPPPCTVIGTVEELFPGFVSIVLVDSETVPVLSMVVPAVPEFTVAAIFKVALELALKVPMVHVPVELA